MYGQGTRSTWELFKNFITIMLKILDIFYNFYRVKEKLALCWKRAECYRNPDFIAALLLSPPQRQANGSYKGVGNTSKVKRLMNDGVGLSPCESVKSVSFNDTQE